MRVFDAPPARATRGRTREIVHRPAVVRPAFERASDDSASEDSGEDSDASSGEEIDDRGVADAREGDRARSGDGSNLVSVSGAGEGRQVVVVGADGVARGVWRAVLYPERGRADAEAEESASEAFRRVIEERDKPWVVVLARGGRFAASAFDVRELGAAGDAPAAAATRHATASRYVVRAKAGGRQVSKDAGGKNIKSAGSSMRRQNEAALEADMRQTFTQWRDVIENASLIFISVSKVDAKTIFNDKNPMLDRNDPRIRRVPFMTGRPTFNETRRVVGRLATMNPNVVEEEERQNPEMDDLTTLADTKFIIAAAPRAAPEPVPEPQEPEIVVPEPELHAAAREGDDARVFALLVEESADPTVMYRGKVAYNVSKDKETRDAFRRAMARLPDAWDWTRGAAVPSALTEEMEAKQAAKEAEYEAARKVKEKERKKAQKDRKKKESAAAALLAKNAPPLEPAPSSGEKKSSALVNAADREARERREQMARAAERRLEAQANARSSIGALGGAQFRDTTSIGGGTLGS